ncbi:uncharacterized protein LOC143898834 isoform X2 [Temnothorax americanus]|uniref:uncharacterized protein LOC143898834 isoform X2 n=1 Tax=Temnothorax americanus TaxID=1964332 RepID=UPI004067642B
MPRSVKDSDDDFEWKAAAGRMQTRMFTVQSVSSPLRRSSRIKQNKYSPDSESEGSSISNSQTIQSTRARTATMDSTVSDTMKKPRTRKLSISSDISEIDLDIPRTPGKRTRQSSGAPGTPTRVNTRAASRLMRAVSETQSPLPAARTMRKIRASSAEPESLFDQNKSRSDSPIKTRKRASMLPSSSLAKEQIELEDRIPYVRLDSTIVEADEITSSGNSDSSPDKALLCLPQSQKIKKRQSISKEEINEDESHEKMETLTDSSKDETLQLLERKNEAEAEDIDSATLKNTQDTLAEGQYKLEKTSDNGSNNEVSTYSSSSSGRRNSVKEDKTIIIEDSLSDIEKSLIDLCKSSKVLQNAENLLNTSTEEQKNDKENEMLNINSDVSVEKSMQLNVIPPCIKSHASPFMNKSLDEKETKSSKKELSKKRRSRESTEIAIKHDDLAKETVNNSQEKMDISTESLNLTATNETILSQHDGTKLVDEVINQDKTSVENISTSTNEDATAVSNEAADDDNEIKLTLESPRRDEIEVSSNVAQFDQTEVLQILSPINKSFNDQTTVTQDKNFHSTEEKQKQENLFKCVTELTPESSNTTLKINNSTRDSNDVVIQDDQSSVIIETSKKSAIDISPEKTDAKDILPEKIVKRNLKRKRCSTDVLDDLEREKERLQMETSPKNQENTEIADDVSDIEGIDLFKDIPADKWKKKNNVKTVSDQSTSQSVEKVENDNETECDLILVDRRAWLAAETIKAAKEAEPFEYDSDDTVLLKSRLDAAQASYNTKKLDVVDEELMDIDSDENEKQVKKPRKSRTKRRLTSEIDQDSSRCTEDEDNLVTADKSNNESKTALNRTNDQSISRLNKSKQSPRTRRRSSKTSDESDKEVENDVSKLNRSSLISNKNTSLRKSVEGRTLNKSSKDTSMQNISTNKSRIDDSEEEIDKTDTHAGKKLNKEKRSNKSRNEDADDDATETEKKNVLTDDNSEKDENTLNRSIDQESKPIETKTTIYLNDDESDNSDISIAAIGSGSKTYSMIANTGSDNNEERRLANLNSCLFSMTKADSDNDTDDSSINSDIKREYNLDGAKQKFSDEDVPADECRASEVEFSDSDDNDSDLTDFIVDDDDVDYEEDEEKENDDDEDMHDLKDDDENVEEDDEAAYEEEEKDEDKQAHIDTESINMEDENEEDEDTQGKDYVADDAEENEFAEMEVISSYTSTSGKSKNNSIQYTSSRKSDTKMKQDIKMKKSIMEKNEKSILLDSSNSDLSIKKKKKKSLVKENDTNLSNASNLSSSSMKKDGKLDPQYSSRDGAKQNSSEALNEYEFLSAKKLPRSRELMKFSTQNGNSCKKLELDEIIEGISENKDIKSDNTITATQNISVMKKKSNKNPALNEDINVKMFSYANKEKMLNSDFSPDLLKLLERTSFSKSTSSKIELHKTMNIIDTETPTIKHLRKEKLNESAPTLKSNIETSSLSTKKKDIAQIKLKEKNNKDESDLILSSDDAIRKRSQKKQKKHKKRDTSKENITNEVLSEGVIEYVPKKKKPVKLTQLTIVGDNIHEDTCQISEKKKKKQDTSKENITDKALSEDVELKIFKKKKPVKSTQLTTVDDNIREDARHISEKRKKKKKKQDTSRENIAVEAVSEGATALKIPKKKKPVKLTQLTIIDDDIHEDALVSEKKKKKKIQDTSKENIVDEALFEDAIELKIPKKKKRAKLIQLPIVEDNTREDICLINEKEKKKKKKQETLKGYITEKVLTEDTVELKIPKKKKRAKFSQLVIIEDDTRQDVYQINEKEKKKKKKQINVVEEDKNVNEDDTCKNTYQSNEKEKKKKKGEALKKNITAKALSEDIVELKISTKKKPCINLNQLAIVYDDADTHEDAYQINEKEKKKKKKKINVVEKDENVNESNILRKNIRENKTGLAQQKKNKIVSSLKLGLLTDKHMLKKKTKQQKAVESTETLWMENNTLPVQIPVSKLKSDKNLLSRKLLQDTLDASKSKNVVHTTKKMDKATAKMCIPTELKLKKKRDRTEDIENVVRVNVPTKKSKKEMKEMTKFLPSSSGLKRLSDDVIENLTDVPLRAKKRRKISQNEEQVVSSVKTGKSKMTTANDSFTLSNSDCSTQFCVVNLQKTKKQPPTGATAAVSFRRRMLARNNREPISAYMMYRDKMNFIK